MAEKEIRLCKNIAKFSQNLPFQLAKFCILDAKFEICFCKKPGGQVVSGGYCPIAEESLDPVKHTSMNSHSKHFYEEAFSPHLIIRLL